MTRPSFDSRIIGNYGNLNFKSKKDEIVTITCLENYGKKKEGDKWCERLLPGSLHLAHVFPWAAIDKCVDDLDNQNTLDEFVKLIFKVDEEAIAPQQWLLERSPVSEELPMSDMPVPHTDYLYDLIDLNKEMMGEALDNCKVGQNLDRCKKVLNSSPANLRFGYGKVNGIIHDRLDLMGDTFGEMTKKERLLADFFAYCYMNLNLWCSRNTEIQYCKYDDSWEKILSSSHPEGYIDTT